VSIDLQVQVIETFAEFWALGPHWRALEEACALTLPFQTWEWSTSWWQHLHEDSAAVRDALRVCVVRRRSGEVVGIAPLMLTQRPGWGPIRARFFQFIGADPNLTEIRQMLCLPELDDACRVPVMRTLAASAPRWHWLAWEAPDRTAEPDDGARWKSAYVLALPRSWDELRTRFRRNIKESLRKCHNSLKRDGLTFSVEVLTEPDEIVAGLGELFRLHRARAELRDTVEHADVFDSPQARAFLIDVSRRLAERGVTRLYQLQIEDRVVAIRLAFEMADMLYLYYSGWDPAYARYSVMTTLVAEAIQDAIRRGLGFVHLSTGNDVSKTRWGADEVRYVHSELIAPGWSSLAIHSAYHRMASLARSRQVGAMAPRSLLRRSRAGQRSSSNVQRFLLVLLLVTGIGTGLALVAAMRPASSTCFGARGGSARPAVLHGG
jgi:CelD/BcsL family acetyltransferase involved in cellulose biosynthesis